MKDIKELKKEADDLEIKYAANISAVALQQRINEAKDPRRTAIKNATKLVRVIVSPNDPSKKELEGEIFTAANSLVKETKYVPYNNTKGWHIPYIIYEMLKEKQTQLFVTKQLKNGESVRIGKQIPAYNITLLDDLTKEELEDLAKAQQARASIDA